MMTKDRTPSRNVPMPSVRRLPQYLRLLRLWRQQGLTHVSCTRLAEALRSDPTQIRKDLSITGTVGRPRIGYEIDTLIEAIQKFLGWNEAIPAVLAGVGNLGSALLGYDFTGMGIRIVAGFDSSPEKIGKIVHGYEVLPVGHMADFISKQGVQVGVLAVPGRAAQSVADLMISGGVQGIWNFTPAAVSAPPNVIVERADFSASLAALCVQLRHKPTGATP